MKQKNYAPVSYNNILSKFICIKCMMNNNDKYLENSLFL